MKIDGIGQLQPVAPLKPDLPRVPGETAPVKEEEQAEEKPLLDMEQVSKAVDLLNRTMKSYNTELRFTMHKGSGEYIIRIINTENNTVIREIPPERVLDMVAYFKEMLGLVIDKFI